jgi:hypothetical protein
MTSEHNPDANPCKLSGFVYGALGPGIVFPALIYVYLSAAILFDPAGSNFPPVHKQIAICLVCFVLGAAMGILMHAQQVVKNCGEPAILPPIVRYLARIELIQRMGLIGAGIGSCVALACLGTGSQKTLGTAVAPSLSAHRYFLDGRLETTLTGTICGGAAGAVVGLTLLLIGRNRVDSSLSDVGLRSTPQGQSVAENGSEGNHQQSHGL